MKIRIKELRNVEIKDRKGKRIGFFKKIVRAIKKIL